MIRFYLSSHDYFTIERSGDGTDFEIIKTIDGAGNSSSALSYSTTDNAPLSGIAYYRLKQTDYNGDYEYFNIVSVAYNGSISDKELSLISYPNPYQGGELNLSSEAFEMGNLIQVKITDLSGKVVYQESVTIEQSSIRINTPLNRGIYVVSVKSNNFNSNTRLLVE